MKKWLCAALFVCTLTLSLGWHVEPIAAHDHSAQTVSPLTSQLASQPAADWQQNLADGIAAYEQGRLSAAIAAWQVATTQATDLTKAYILSNLAAAYLQLGALTTAQSAVAESVEIVNAWPTRDQQYWDVSARVLNTQGQLLWQQGNAQQALANWEQAEDHYRTASASPTAGLMTSQINQAIARQELGFNLRAVEQLTEVYQQIERQRVALSPQLKIKVLKELSGALRQIGEFSQAQSVLLTGLQLAGLPFTHETTHLFDRRLESVEAQQLALELGHTLRSLSHQARSVGKVNEARNYSQQALAAYGAVAISASSSALSAAPSAAPSAASSPTEDSPIGQSLQRQAQLNQLSYLIETNQLSAAQALGAQIDLAVLPPGRDRTEAYISYAHSLNCLQAPNSAACVKTAWQADPDLTDSDLAEGRNPHSLSQQAELLAAAIRQSQALEDPVLLSYATGELGHTYELSGQRQEALSLTQQALEVLQGRQLPEIAYRWEWQLGRLYQADDADKTNATSAYRLALSSLSLVRQNLSRINPQVQFSFRDNVEPLYREFVTLLLAQYASPSAIQASPIESPIESPAERDLLSLAVNTIDALQIAELEDFLGCNVAQLVTLTETGIDPKAAKIYPILLPEQLAIVVDIPGQPLLLRTVPVPQRTVEATVRSLRNNLTLPGKTPEVLTDASQLYDWLMAPIETVLLANESIDTLVFIPDGPLRNIPMGVLYDGEQYLIEKQYAIATAPQLTLFAPRALTQPLKILRGGVSLPQTVRGRDFPSIELVQAELEQIPDELTAAPPLLNRDFTKENIEQQLARERYTAIHWKTHGVFSSDPQETFLVAYEEGIGANELSELVLSARVRQSEPLELLVLSACETAQGDSRAVLGLAGIAVRTGTRSTLSTLWRADDGANTLLMDAFYQGLIDGLTKAQALQQAQQSLLSLEGYPAPYYWAPYTLVGNWL